MDCSEIKISLSRMRSKSTYVGSEMFWVRRMDGGLDASGCKVDKVGVE